MLQQDYSRLMTWYRDSKRDLPWRLSTDPYRVMVSEFMLQQTTVAAVIPKYLTWLSRFPDVTSLAVADLDDVLLHWSGLGYYQRARRLHAAAIEVHRLGDFPTTAETLAALPGFGPYTAAAVASICYDRPVLAIDTNVIRVLYRYFGLAHRAQEKKIHDQLRTRMQSLLELGDAGDTNQALMELGATHCSVKKPDCKLCPLRRGCRAKVSASGPESFPLAKVKKKVKRTPTMAIIIEERSTSRLLLTKGTSLGLLSDLYQPMLFFGEERDQHPISQACLRLLKEFESHSTETWTLNYGISGRRLEVTGIHWSLGDDDVRRALEILREHELNAVFWDKDEQGLALSSLTRKVLSKWSESL